MPILLLVACATKLKVMPGDEVYLQNNKITHGTQSMYLSFINFDGFDIRDYRYNEVSSEQSGNHKFIIPSGDNTIQVNIEYEPGNATNNSENSTFYWQSFTFDVTTYPQQTYKAVSQVERNKATVWIINDSGEKISERISKVLIRSSDNSKIIDPDNSANNYTPYFPVLPDDSSYYYRY